MTEQNTYIDTRARRRCRQCATLLVLRHKAKCGLLGKSQQAANETLPCPFCGHDGFTRAELKAHFGVCEVFYETEAA